jgi:hypothetical protein
MAMGELAPVLLGELHSTYLPLAQHRPDVLVGLIDAYDSV